MTRLVQFNERTQHDGESAVDFLNALVNLCEAALPTTPSKERQELIKD